jgi:hypothetical protein
MAGAGTLVEARFPPSDRVGTEDATLAPPDDYAVIARYEGPAGPLVIAQHDDCRAVWVGGAPDGALQVPWGPLDSIDDPGAYRRLVEGVASEGDGIPLVIRLVGTSVRTSKRWLEIDVGGGHQYQLRRRALRGTRLVRDDGRVVAKGFRGKVIEVASDASSLEAALVAAVWASVERMLFLPAMPSFEIPGD